MKMEEEKKKAEEKMRNAEEGKRMAEERQRQAEEQKRQVQREKEKLADEVIRTREELRKARGRMETTEREKREMPEKLERTKQQLTGLPIWVGTGSLQTLDRTAHNLTPTTLTQIYQGIIGKPAHPLPENATQYPCGSWLNGIGGDFSLWTGGMWRLRIEFRPEGTNKKCDRIGQTAAIRVTKWRREARLFVDDEEQPGMLPNIPSPLCIGISTGFTDSDYQSVDSAVTNAPKFNKPPKIEIFSEKCCFGEKIILKKIWS
ncbi:hypothetical protein BLNAU_15926 [Blattamonas nauphoetae]|uniref:Uncharacterized protein n=1 Tax=Blattamonas nauphoetae TaxID=2049346 RepID=A0ABQ9XDA0_9EUKA|nr:hypothetical protein BLNAU_15926 [Blattamonas nauphoetae]